jgi:hypothetical protein
MSPALPAGARARRAARHRDPRALARLARARRTVGRVPRARRRASRRLAARRRCPRAWCSPRTRCSSRRGGPSCARGVDRSPSAPPCASGACRTWADTSRARSGRSRRWGLLARRAGVSAVAATGASVLVTLVNVAAGFAVVLLAGARALELVVPGGAGAGGRARGRRCSDCRTRRAALGAPAGRPLGRPARPARRGAPADRARRGSGPWCSPTSSPGSATAARSSCWPARCSRAGGRRRSPLAVGSMPRQFSRLRTWPATSRSWCRAGSACASWPWSPCSPGWVSPEASRHGCSLSLRGCGSPRWSSSPGCSSWPATASFAPRPPLPMPPT